MPLEFCDHDTAVRQVIARHRAEGSFLRRILIVGDQDCALHLSKVLKSAPHARYVRVTATIPGYAQTRHINGVPIIEHEHDLDSILDALNLSDIDALAISLDSRGPVFFHQQRIGKHGQPFSMLKFRSMVVDAEARKASLDADDRGNPVLFKMRQDPRVTRVGAIIRRASIDELPQLINVLKGEMSLIGPRPPLGSEVATYEHHVHRRFMVQPGITGLWQVSGRSDLSWDESVRLDLYYVENWSMTQDLLILAKTLRAVVSSDGAY